MERDTQNMMPEQAEEWYTGEGGQAEDWYGFMPEADNMPEDEDHAE
jgi:hypothetical protein